MNPYEENADHNGSPAQRADAIRSSIFKAGQQNGLSLEMQGEAYCQGVLVGLREVVELIQQRQWYIKGHREYWFKISDKLWQAKLKEWGL